MESELTILMNQDSVAFRTTYFQNGPRPSNFEHEESKRLTLRSYESAENSSTIS